MPRIIFTAITIGLKPIYCVCILLWLWNQSPVASAQSVTQSQNNISTEQNNSVSLLTISDTDSVAIIKPGVGLWDFKDINPLDYDDSSGYTLDHEFTLINRNNKVVIITAIEGVDPRVDFNLPYCEKTLPVTLPPDGLITVKLHYRLLPLILGKLHISEMVFIANQVQPSAILQFAGTIQKVVTFNPSVLDFGFVSPGQIVSKVLKVTYDPQMYPGRMPVPPQNLPLLVCDKSFIAVKQTAINYSKITRLPGVDDATNSNKKFRQILDAMPPINNVVIYLVTVKSPAGAGPFHGFISVMPVVGTTGYDILNQESIAVQGRVSIKE